MGTVNYINTYNNILFDPISPQIDDIIIEDISHALSLICRGNGHFKSFYSVGQHSINCMREAKARRYSEKIQLACLLHDASEAYISDITRPVKQALPQYLNIEKSLQDLIWLKWLGDDFTSEEYNHVFEIDDAMLYHEFIFFMQERILNFTPELISKPIFEFSSFLDVENQFLHCFNSFFNKDYNSFTVGVDWCSGKWLAVKLQNSNVEYYKYKNIEELCEAHGDAGAILIDIPIGLPESAEEVALRPDRLIKSILKGKKSSVFNVPFRQIAMADSLAEAWDLNRALNAKMQPLGMSLRASVRQVDLFLQKHEPWKNKLMESHPELAFLTLNDYQPLKFSKLTKEGEEERISILNRHCNSVTQLIEQYKSDVPYRKKIDDLLDAFSLALIGQLGLRNGFHLFPENPNIDRTGLKMQMVTAKR